MPRRLAGTVMAWTADRRALPQPLVAEAGCWWGRGGGNR